MRTGQNYTRAAGRSRAAMSDAVRETRAEVVGPAGGDGVYCARLVTVRGGELVASADGATPRHALRALRAALATRGRGVYSEEMRRTDLRAIQTAAESA